MIRHKRRNTNLWHKDVEREIQQLLGHSRPTRGYVFNSQLLRGRIQRPEELLRDRERLRRFQEFWSSQPYADGRLKIEQTRHRGVLYDVPGVAVLPAHPASVPRCRVTLGPVKTCQTFRNSALFDHNGKSRPYNESQKMA